VPHDRVRYDVRTPEALTLRLVPETGASHKRIRLKVTEDVDRFLSVGGAADMIALSFEFRTQHGTKGILVINHQNQRRRWRAFHIFCIFSPWGSTLGCGNLGHLAYTPYKSYATFSLTGMATAPMAGAE